MKKNLITLRLCALLVFALATISVMARKKSELQGSTCSPLIKDKPETPEDESKNSPCSCQDANGNIWRCDNCDDPNSDCGDGPILTGPYGSKSGVVIIGYYEGIVAYDLAQPGKTITDLSSLSGKKFNLRIETDKNKRNIQVWTETKGNEEPGTNESGFGLPVISLIISIIALVASLSVAIIKRRNINLG